MVEENSNGLENQPRLSWENQKPHGVEMNHPTEVGPVRPRQPWPLRFRLVCYSAVAS